MNSQFLIEKLKDSKEYKKFMKENPDAYLCSGFFVISENKGENKYHFDFYVPSSKKTFSFELENENSQQIPHTPNISRGSCRGIKLVLLERNDEEVLEKVSMKKHFNFDNLKEKIMKEMELRRIKNKIQKMIFSLQNKDGTDFLLGTIFLSGFGLLKVNIDITENEITAFEKKSFFDMLNIVRRK